MLKTEIIDSILRISKANNFDAAWHEVQKAAEKMEFKIPYYLCAYRPDSSETFQGAIDNQNLVYRDEHPDAFNEFYIDGNYADYDLAIDWVVNQKKTASFSEIFMPITGGVLNGKYRELYDIYQDYELKYGAMIPLNNRSGLGIAGMTILAPTDISQSQSDKLIDERMGDMEILAQVFHNSRSLHAQALKQFRFTAQEKEILRRIAMGQRAKQIAHEQNKFVGVIEKQIANIKRKLAAKTLPEAISKATHFELIDFS